MKSIVLTEPGKFELKDAPLPPPPGPDEVQIRVRRVGICGTDLHAFQGNQPFFSYPRILGHELAAEITAIGRTQRPTDWKVGEKCSVLPYLNCGKCGACLRGYTNCCMNLKVLGVHCDGGMRELINVPLDKLYRSSLDDEQLALVEMLSIGAHAVRRAQIIPGEFALVVGVGPIGLGVSLFAKQAGARVIAMDVNAARLKFAQERAGVEFVINALDNPLDQLKAFIPNDLPTVVLDATGNPKSMMKSFEYTAHGGRLVFVGLFQGDVTFNDPEFHRRELTLLATRNATAQDFKHVISSLEQGNIDVHPWITHHASPEAMVRDFSSWLKPENNVVKAMLAF